MWRRLLPVAARAAAPARAVHASAGLLARRPRNSSLRVREAELQQEIAHLEKELRLVEKQEQVARVTASLPPLDDATLEAMYQELLTAPQEEHPPRLPDPTPRALERLAMRLGVQGDLGAARAAAAGTDAAGVEAPSMEAVDAAAARSQSPETEAVHAGVAGAEEDRVVQDVRLKADAAPAAAPAAVARQARRTRLLEQLAACAAAQNHESVPDDLTEGAAAPTTQDPLPDVPPDEWAALAVDSARDADLEQALQTLDLMEHSGVAAEAPLYTRLLDTFANRGAIAACVALSARMEAAGLVADAPVKHAMVKAYVYGDELYAALGYLQGWEAREPAPVSAYTVLIEHLLKHPVRDVHSLAWSLFYHMRFAAHPVPDAAAFALMIRACAAGVPQPGSRARAPAADAERALDLFREMTTRHGLRPNKEVYDSLVLTCARRKEHYGDAVRLVRELLDASAEILAPEARSAMWADTYTFNALLQGSARTGDLRTARWVLAEMLRATYDGDERCRVNEETMTNIFWAYAVYEPPLQEEDLRVYGEVESAGGAEHGAGAPASDARADAAAKASDVSGAEPAPGAEPATPAVRAEPDAAHTEPEAPPAPSEAAVFTHAMPQTAQEVLGEVRALLARVLADQDADAAHAPLHSVRATPRLLNAYLAVLTHHLPRTQQLDALVHAVEDADGVFAHARVAPNGHTFALVLGACAASRTRADADRVAARVWAQWEALCAATPASAAAGTDAKTVSRMWALGIRNKAKSYDVDGALALLRTFYERYPPRRREPAEADAAPPVPAPHGTAIDLMPVPPTRGALDALARRGGRRGTAHYPALAPARPALRFADLDLLHHRCVALRRVDGIRLVTHVDRAYTPVA